MSWNLTSHVSFAAHGRNIVNCLELNEEWIITGSDDWKINVYETNTTKLHAALRGHKGCVWALELIGKTLVSGSTDSTVRVWDIEEAKCTHVLSGHTSTVRCLRILQPPSYPIIVTGSRDCSIRLWRLPDLEAGAPEYPADDLQEADNSPFFLRALRGHTKVVRAIAGYGNILVSGSDDSFVYVWKIDSGKCIFRLVGHTGKVYSVVIDSKRSRCISGSMDFSVKIWSLDSGSCLYTLEGHTHLVGLVGLYGDLLISSSADSTLRVWDAENGQCLHELAGHIGAITSFQHNDKVVISGSSGTIKLWNIRTGNLIKDLVTDLQGRCVAAVTRGSFTFVEVTNWILTTL
ncbi:WD40-repeat-containing domain protein [Lipomyces kononenkoae]